MFVDYANIGRTKHIAFDVGPYLLRPVDYGAFAIGTPSRLEAHPVQLVKRHAVMIRSNSAPRVMYIAKIYSDPRARTFFRLLYLRGGRRKISDR